MKIEGLFLRSRAGRRIFWTLMLAAAAPIALFGWLVQGALRDHFSDQAQRQRVQAAKYAGMSMLDNLIVARTVLGIFARSGTADAASPLPNQRGRVLADLALLDDQGALKAGSPALWQRWQLGPQEGATAPGTTATLVIGPGRSGEGAASILMVLRRADEPGLRWIGEIDPHFLFGELVNESGEARICVERARGGTIFCPDPQAAQADHRGRPVPATPASWSLFLRSDFGVDDWVFVNVAPAEDLSLESIALTHTTAWGALATLLVVVMLSLMQVRRTMVPLERLIEGTRRLARRDFAARVRHDSRDEFGELARSFNHMASQIGTQIQAMEVHASIDREIVNGLDVPLILQQVARRLGQLLSPAPVAVLELDRSARDLVRVHQGSGAFGVIHLPDGDDWLRGLDDGPGLRQWPEPQPALRSALPWTVGELKGLRVRAGSDLVAVIVVGAVVDHAPTEAVLREVDELGVRVAVALAAADRERLLIERAARDSLTGLANRSGLLEHLARALASRDAFSLLFVDLDRFKEVNDAMGHQAGDQLLRVMAARLQEVAPVHALVSRPGGDEFVIVVPGLRAAAQTVAERLLTAAAQPLTVDDRVVAVTASIGMTHHPDDGVDASDLLRRADMAMYSVKARGGRGASWFEPVLDARMTERADLLADLRDALARGQFELHYQPRRHVRSGELRSAEALLRWHHPARGLVPPDRFVPLLEETGQIDAIGQWAIATACRQLAAWQAQGLPLQSVAVNLSTRQLQTVAIVEQVACALREAALPPSSLELEVTESIFIGDSASAIDRLRAIQRLGVRIALDDFGTGYSSLSYLQKLPVGILKIDRSFVAELDTRPTAMAVARSIVALARAFDLQVVAEGVETEQQSKRLVELGCDELQGYLIARPLPASELAARLLNGTPVEAS